MTSIPTIYDVARLAGVSISTVSRVLNGSAKVSEETRRKVEEAMRVLNYRPHPAARGLTLGRTQLIALIVPDISNPFFAELAKGVQNVCDEHGYAVVIWSTDGRVERELKAIDSLPRQQVEGVCFFRHLTDDTAVRRLAEQRVPAVLVGSLPKGIALDSVGTFGTGAALIKIVDTLVAQGRKALAYISGPREAIVSQIRREHYLSAVRHFSLRADDDLIQETHFSREGGRAAALRLLSKDDRPDMIFAANDVLAAGALQAAHELNLRVPEDVAIFGCDDIELSSLLRPSLTTISLPKYEMGQKAAELVLARIQYPDTPWRHLSLEARPVFRESTGLTETVMEVRQ